MTSEIKIELIDALELALVAKDGIWQGQARKAIAKARGQS